MFNKFSKLPFQKHTSTILVQQMIRFNTVTTSILLALLMAACGGTKKMLKQADREQELGKFESAIQKYEQALADPKVDSAYVVKQLAEAYRQSNRLEKAAPYYEILVKKGGRPEYSFYYAEVLKKKGNYEEAKNYYSQYMSKATDPQMKALAQMQIENMDKISEIARKKTRYEVDNFGQLNTESDDFAPHFYEDHIVFTSGRGEGKVFEGDGSGMYDLYIYQFDGADEASGAVKPFGEKINTPDAHEANATFTPDGKTMIFVRSNKGEKGDRAEVDLYYTRERRDEWSEPTLLPISDSATWDGTPAFDPTGSSLYFASNRRGGLGGLDIWRAQLDSRGRIRRVTNLGPQINTPGDEMFPYVSESGHLYFSSDGHPGLGGLDLFRAEKDGREIIVQNMGKPMNSPADDFAVALNSPIEGYFSSNREGGKGGDDIYHFLEKDVVLKVANYFIDGEVRDEDNNQLENVKIELRDNDKNVLATTTTDASGQFKLPVEIKSNYVVFLDYGEDYFKKEVEFTTHGKSVAQEDLVEDSTNVDLPFRTRMAKIEKGRTFQLENVYYDYSATEIQEESFDELDKLVTMLEDNPKVKIEIVAHTDKRGNDDFNMKLSQGRAESVVNFLTEAGISQDRLVPIGKGETQPIIPNAVTEEEHQKNRRTEFKVIDK